MLRAIPKQSKTRPMDVKDRPKRLYGCGVKWYGIIRNYSGLSTVTTVSSNPPIKNIDPITVIKYPTVSLCLDSSAFSCKYSLKNIEHMI